MGGGVAPSSSGHIVLIADTDEAIRAAIRDLLEAGGYTVIEANTSAGALAILADCPDCLILLYSNSTPHGQDALEFFSVIAHDPILATRHVYLYLSTSPERSLPALDEVLATLGVSMLAKPFDVDQLLTAIAAAGERLAD